VISTINAEPFITDGMVDNVQVSGTNLVITFNIDAGKQPISIPLSSIFNPENYYDKTAIDGMLQTAYADTNTALNALSAATDTKLATKADTSALTQHISDSNAHFTGSQKSNYDAFEGQFYVDDSWDVTPLGVFNDFYQSEYPAAMGQFDQRITSNTNAIATKADTSAVTAAVDAVTPCVFDFGKASTLGITDEDWNNVMDAYVNHKPIIGVLGSSFYTCESLVLNTVSDNQVFTFTVSDGTSRYILDVTNLGNSQYQITRYDTIALPTTNDITNWNAKQDTLVSGTNIKTINNTSLLGSGNIDIQGGGGSSSISSCTQAQYDAAEQGGTLDSDTMYVISDAPAVNIANYYTKTEVDDLLLNVDIDVDTAITAGGTNAVEGGAIYTALQGKVNNGDAVVRINTGSTDNATVLQYSKDGSSYTTATFIGSINGTKIATNTAFQLASISDVNYYSYGNYSATTSAFLNGTFYAIEILNPANLVVPFYFRMDGNVSYGVKVVNNVLTFTDGSGNVITKPSFISDDSYYDSVNNNAYIYFVEGRYCNYISNTQSYSLRLATSLTTTSIKDKVSSLETALGGMTLRKLTQAQYDELVTKDPNTLYIITNVVNNA
jgi:hypothetical protein